MKLLPEWRKAATNIGRSVSFGTVDCTLHGDLCSQVKENVNTVCCISCRDLVCRCLFGLIQLQFSIIKVFLISSMVTEVHMVLWSLFRFVVYLYLFSCNRGVDITCVGYSESQSSHSDRQDL